MAGIDTFPNKYPDRDYEITHVNPEFTSVCPMTGLPDFATITVYYIPDALCIELKSLKYYFLEFRNKGIYFESAINQILDDLVEVCAPRYMKVTGAFNTRGGIHSIITAEHVSSKGAAKAAAKPSGKAAAKASKASEKMSAKGDAAGTSKKRKK